MLNNKKIGLVSSLLLTLLVLPVAKVNAQSPITLKMAVVNLQRVINESVVGKQSQAKLESLLKSKNAEFQAAEKKIIGIRSEIESPLLNDEAKRNKIKEIEEMQAKYLRDRQNADQELQNNEINFTKKIVDDIKKILEKDYNKQYDMILEFATFSTILYKNFKVEDITDDVIKKYDDQKN